MTTGNGLTRWRVRRPTLSRADLLRSLADQVDSEERVREGALLGFEWTGSAPSSSTDQPLQAAAFGVLDAIQSTATGTVTGPPTPLRAPVLWQAMPVEHQASQTSPRPPQKGVFPCTDDEVEAMMVSPRDVVRPPMPPLVSPGSLWPRLMGPSASATTSNADLDVPAAIEKLAQLRHDQPWPHLPGRTLRPHRVLVLDTRQPLQCYLGDVQEFIDRYVDLHGRAGLEVFELRHGPGGPITPAWAGQSHRRWADDTQVLVVSDFGLHDADAGRCWRQWSGNLRHSGARLQALFLGAQAELRTVRQTLAASTEPAVIVPWAPPHARAAAGSDLEMLLAALSLAVSVEPDLLRAMRLVVAPGVSPSLEAAAWGHASLIGGSQERVWRSAAHAANLSCLQDAAAWPLTHLLTAADVLWRAHAHKHLAQRDEETLRILHVLVPWMSSQCAASDDERHALAKWRTRGQEANERTLRLAANAELAQRPGATHTRITAGAKAGYAQGRLSRWTGSSADSPQDLRIAWYRAAFLSRFHRGEPVPTVDGLSPDDLLLEGAPSAREGLVWQVVVQADARGLWCAVLPEESARSPWRLSLTRLQIPAHRPWLTIEHGGQRTTRRLFAAAAKQAPVCLITWREPFPTGVRLSWADGHSQVLRAERRPASAPGWFRDTKRVWTAIEAPWGADLKFPFPASGSGWPVHPKNDWSTPDSPVHWDANADDFGPFLDLILEKGGAQRLRYIPPGTFLMGSPAGTGIDAERPQHPVTLVQGFWLADTLCTQALWQAVMGKNPSRFKGDPNLPVDSVSWDMVQAFLQRLNEKLPSGCRAELPSEAQWEYACRAGTRGDYWWGDIMDIRRANVSESGLGKTTSVRAYDPNPWGLYDLHGNLWEWCSDAPRPYSGEPQVDPTGGTENGARALRGGAWSRHAAGARSAYRDGFRRAYAWGSLGLRFLLRSSQAQSGPGEPGIVPSGDQNARVVRPAGPRVSGAAGGGTGQKSLAMHLKNLLKGSSK